MFPLSASGDSSWQMPKARPTLLHGSCRRICASLLFPRFPNSLNFPRTCSLSPRKQRGFRDFVLLEMEKQPGGNSRWGENEITAYPWAAHYVPVPNAKATLVRELFEEFGALKDGKWEERYLCFTPQERLFIHGRWQEGIEPAVGLRDGDRDQFKRFDDLMQQFRASKSFTIPTQFGMDGSQRPEVAALDHVSIAEWLQQKKLDSAYLRWYV